jgi:hypothetical protein
VDSGEALHAHTFSFCLVDALVDAGAPAVLALALAAFMLADAGAPAVLALAPAAGADAPADADEYCSIRVSVTRTNPIPPLLPRHPIPGPQRVQPLQCRSP